MDDEHNSSEDEIAAVKEKLQSLNARLEKKEKPWYKEVSSLVAVIALLFSFSTTFVSYLKSIQQEVLSDRVELKNIINEISNLPKLHMDMLKQYEKEPEKIAKLSGVMNAKNIFLTNQAVAILDRIENNWYGKSTVSDIEYYTIGGFLLDSMLVEKARFYLGKAIERARDSTVYTGALRSLAGSYMAGNDFSSMRKYMRRASLVYEVEKYRNTPQFVQDITNITTEIQWAEAEFFARSCTEAQEHVSKAEDIAAQLPVGDAKNQQMSLVGKVNVTIQYNCG